MKERKQKLFFEKLCTEYHEKILRYLYHSLGDEAAAKDCTQEVFLVACQKLEELYSHPNPGGFLYQTAKNLAAKARRETYTRLTRELSVEEDHLPPVTYGGGIEETLDRQIDEYQYIDAVLSQLTDEKRRLYSLYYINHKSMAEIALLLNMKEPAVRMRYVRLRQEIRELVSAVAAENFYY